VPLPVRLPAADAVLTRTDRFRRTMSKVISVHQTSGHENLRLENRPD